MAEAFGVGAGIVGVLGLTIQITQAVVKFGQHWKDAPKDVREFMSELQSLKTVLSETRTNLEDPIFKEAFRDRPSVLRSELGPELGQNPPTMVETQLSIESCKAKLEKELKVLKLRDEGHRLGWERLKGAFLADSTLDSVQKLRRYGELFNNMVSIDAMTLAVTTVTGMKEMRREQQEWHNDEKNQAILHWISSLSFEERQRDILSKRHPETGQWLLDNEVFYHWRNGVLGEPSVLWCPGIGKTLFLPSISLLD